MNYIPVNASGHPQLRHRDLPLVGKRAMKQRPHVRNVFCSGYQSMFAASSHLFSSCVTNSFIESSSRIALA